MAKSSVKTKTEHEPSYQAALMRKKREKDPDYGQPRVNRATVAYCPKCNRVMPWGEALGIAKYGPLRCPHCETELKTLVRSRSVANTNHRNTRTYCAKCLREGYWINAKTKADPDTGEEEYACTECGEPLYSIQDQKVRSGPGGRPRKTCAKCGGKGPLHHGTLCSGCYGAK